MLRKNCLSATFMVSLTLRTIYSKHW